jgi:hypothetical protein
MALLSFGSRRVTAGRQTPARLVPATKSLSVRAAID